MPTDFESARPLALGILVHGDNHFIVRGPEPNRDTALELVELWTVIHIGQSTPPRLTAWRISTKEFREDLQWAIVVPAETNHSEAVTRLLSELVARGIPLRHTNVSEAWTKSSGDAVGR